MSTAMYPDKVRDLVAEVLAVDPRELSDDSGPLTMRGWSSRKHLELVVTLEEVFGISLSNAEIVAMRSVADIRAVLAGKGATW
jgi:acyl carrier protein